eukprot:3432594-Pleurochrysis_carterae.AAC.3
MDEASLDRVRRPATSVNLATVSCTRLGFEILQLNATSFGRAPLAQPNWDDHFLNRKEGCKEETEDWAGGTGEKGCERKQET